MATKASSTIKVVLIASLILNLAFISGFVVKKISASTREESCEPLNCGHTCINDQHQVGYRYFCIKPGFKEAFEEYRAWHRGMSRKLSQIKTAYLRELKKENCDRAAVDRLIGEMNRTSGELNEKNYRHLQALKGLLSRREFASLIDCMNHTLEAHRGPSIPLQPIPCTGTENHHNHSQTH
jgi:hypothetical protein